MSCSRARGERVRSTQQDTSVEDLAEVMFLGNRAGKRFGIDLESVETTKGLFFFLLDLLHRGLALTYGCLELANMSADQFAAVAAKMGSAGIRVELERHEGAPAPPPHDRQVHINLPELLAMPDDAPLNSFVLRIEMGWGVSVRMRFSLSFP